jgi:UDP-glucose 4-epimerase
MNILIVGGSGEVGRYLTADYVRRGHSVRILDLAPASPEMQTNSGVTYFRGDIADRELTAQAADGAEVVINLAWSFADNPHTIFGTDILGTAHLLDAAAKSGARSFVYASTAVVYGRAVHHPVTEEHPCLIEEARKPFYALGKHAAEKLCLLYGKEKGLPVSILRFWWAYGETIGGKHLRELIKTALEGRPIPMVRGAGGAFVTMADLAQAVTLITEQAVSSGQTYNAASIFLTWEEIGRMIIELTNSSSSIELVRSEYWQGPAFLNEVWDLSAEKAAATLGFRPQYTDTEARARLMTALGNCASQLKQ